MNGEVRDRAVGRVEQADDFVLYLERSFDHAMKAGFELAPARCGSGHGHHLLAFRCSAVHS